MEWKLVYKISKEADKLYREEIEIPCTAEYLHLNVEFEETLRYMGFLFVEDPDGKIRLQKLLGYGEQKLGIGIDTEHTTVGGVSGMIQKGTWKIGLGIFSEYVEQKLQDREGRISVTVTDEKKEISDPIGGTSWADGQSFAWNKVFQNAPKWYKGDFHTHTRLSDGKESIQSAMKKAEDMHMDFYVPTEHNLMHTGWCDTNICIVPGIEITTDLGHMNVFGITKLPDRMMDMVAHNGETIMEQYMDDCIEEAKRNQWITSINHPFLTIWKWEYENTRLEDIDCMEIINDPTYQDARESNDKAIRFLDKIWNEGYCIYGVGGSDSHNLIDEYYKGATMPSVAGDPATYVFCEQLSPENVLHAVKKGHICISRFCQIEPFIQMGDKTYLPGDKIISDGKNVDYRVKIIGLKEMPQIYLVKNGEYILMETFKTGEERYEAVLSFELEEMDWQWFRAEVRDQKGNFLAYVNPVYKGKKESAYKTFGELKAYD